MPKEPILEKTEILLTKRNFVGYAWFHIFTNDETGAEFPVECTEMEYTRLGEVGGEQFNPTLEGHTWKYSLGRAMKVDSPTGLLSDREYAVIGDEAHIAIKEAMGGGVRVPVADVVEDKIEIEITPKAVIRQ
jgi:hypothetical protein